MHCLYKSSILLLASLCLAAPTNKNELVSYHFRTDFLGQDQSYGRCANIDESTSFLEILGKSENWSCSSESKECLHTKAFDERNCEILKTYCKSSLKSAEWQPSFYCTPEGMEKTVAKDSSHDMVNNDYSSFVEGVSRLPYLLNPATQPEDDESDLFAPSAPPQQQESELNPNSESHIETNHGDSGEHGDDNAPGQPGNDEHVRTPSSSDDDNAPGQPGHDEHVQPPVSSHESDHSEGQHELQDRTTLGNPIERDMHPNDEETGEHNQNVPAVNHIANGIDHNNDGPRHVPAEAFIHDIAHENHFGNDAAHVQHHQLNGGDPWVHIERLDTNEDGFVVVNPSVPHNVPLHIDIPPDHNGIDHLHQPPSLVAAATTAAAGLHQHPTDDDRRANIRADPELADVEIRPPRDGAPRPPVASFPAPLDHPEHQGADNQHHTPPASPNLPQRHPTPPPQHHHDASPPPPSPPPRRGGFFSRFRNMFGSRKNDSSAGL